MKKRNKFCIILRQMCRSQSQKFEDKFPIASKNMKRLEMYSALPPSRGMNPSCLAQLKSLQVQPLRMVVKWGQDREDEVRVLDAVTEEEAGGPTRWIPRRGTLEFFHLRRKSMRSSLALVNSVSPRSGHKMLIVWAPVLGSPQPASPTC